METHLQHMDNRREQQERDGWITFRQEATRTNQWLSGKRIERPTIPPHSPGGRSEAPNSPQLRGRPFEKEKNRPRGFWCCLYCLKSLSELLLRRKKIFAIHFTLQAALWQHGVRG